jgi:glycosyltransferase involved in cell wall biosynthesis
MKVCLSGPFNRTGVGTFNQFLALGFLEAIQGTGVEFHINCTNAPNLSLSPMISNEMAPLMMKEPLKEYDLVIHSVLPQSYRDTIPAKKKVLYTVFETSRLTHEQVEATSKAEKVVVTSNDLCRVYDSYRKHGTPEANVIPAGVKTLVPHAKITPSNVLEIVHVGKWEKRKAQYFLPGIIDNSLLLNRGTTGYRGDYRRANLTGFWDNPWNRDADVIGIRSSTSQIPLWGVPEEQGMKGVFKTGRDLTTVMLMKPVEFEEQIQACMAASNLALYINRGEGWCLPAIESMALGVPTVCPPIMGSYDYARDYYAFLKQMDDGPDRFATGLGRSFPIRSR